MNRRTFLAALSGVAGAAMPRPNVVLILADDMGWGDVAMNGCPDVATPHIDLIARQGVRLTQFYANAPECTPTRCALLTGRYQHRVGGLECAIGVNNLGRYDEAEWLQKKGELGLPVGELTLARLLRGGGYDTACFGKWHLGYMAKFGPLRHGFDAYFGILGGNSDYFTHEEMGEGAGHSQLYEGERPVQRKGYLTDLFTDAAVDWLGRGRQGKPFFAVYGAAYADSGSGGGRGGGAASGPAPADVREDGGAAGCLRGTGTAAVGDDGGGGEHSAPVFE
jgi:N-acetylgalactosamine-6-sulfatase